MKKLFCLLLVIMLCNTGNSQSPCGSDPAYRQFDFWIGEWDVFGIKGNKAGDSRISLILDSCIILEEWASTVRPGTFAFSGKSFNTYNATTKQWQQTWVDNAGGSTEYLKGRSSPDQITFMTEPFQFRKDTMAIRRLSFYRLGKDKVRQHGEISKDNGSSWVTEYDLEYRRRR